MFEENREVGKTLIETIKIISKHLKDSKYVFSIASSSSKIIQKQANNKQQTIPTFTSICLLSFAWQNVVIKNNRTPTENFSEYWCIIIKNYYNIFHVIIEFPRKFSIFGLRSTVGFMVLFRKYEAACSYLRNLKGICQIISKELLFGY